MWGEGLKLQALAHLMQQQAHYDKHAGHGPSSHPESLSYSLHLTRHNVLQSVRVRIQLCALLLRVPAVNIAHLIRQKPLSYLVSDMSRIRMCPPATLC